MSREPWKISREMFLSEDETAALLKHLETQERNADSDSARLAAITDRVIVETLLFSGLRNSEFCQLQVGDAAVGRSSTSLVVRETPRQNRVVHVPETLSRLIARYVLEARPQLVPAGVSPTDKKQPLIFNERGKPYERTALYRRVVRILAAAGLADRASVQLLRHTYGYLAYKRTGGNLLFVQRQLGHAHPMVTAVYAEFVRFTEQDLANQIAEVKPTVPRSKQISRRPSR
jgi:integrase/recombinase XerD